VLYRFWAASSCADGSGPSAGLVFDAAGSLYGATMFGGAFSSGCYTEGSTGCGVVFKLTPGTSGNWTEKVLHNFRGKDGANPAASLIFDYSGNLYGTTLGGGYYLSGCELY